MGEALAARVCSLLLLLLPISAVQDEEDREEDGEADRQYIFA